VHGTKRIIPELAVVVSHGCRRSDLGSPSSRPCPGPCIAHVFLVRPPVARHLCRSFHFPVSGNYYCCCRSGCRSQFWGTAIFGYWAFGLAAICGCDLFALEFQTLWELTPNQSAPGNAGWALGLRSNTVGSTCLSRGVRRNSECKSTSPIARMSMAVSMSRTAAVHFVPCLGLSRPVCSQWTTRGATAS